MTTDTPTDETPTAAELPFLPGTMRQPVTDDHLFSGDFSPLDEVLDVYADEEPGQFVVDNLDKAEWASTRYRRSHDRMDDRKRIVEDRIARLRTWLEDANKNDERAAEFFASLLDHFHRETLAADPKAKSIKLPDVTLKSVASKAAAQFDDAQAFAKWALVNAPDVVTVERTYKVAVVPARKVVTVADGKVIDANGEEVPGTSVKPASTSYSIALVK